MPKCKRVCSLSAERSKASPFHCGSKDNQEKSRNVFETNKDVKEWEEARCPICMENPHSAVLLRCSSHNKGCRPYICNTSNRHSNCLAQFQKSLTDSLAESNSEEASYSRKARLKPKLTCPLCRGQINGWVVVESARQFMNSRPRSCPSDACNYVGTYLELRNHIRKEHPSIRPSEVDPSRQREWQRLERERELKDVLCVMLSDLGDNISPALFENLLNRFLMAMRRDS